MSSSTVDLCTDSGFFLQSNEKCFIRRKRKVLVIYYIDNDDGIVPDALWAFGSKKAKITMKKWQMVFTKIDRKCCDCFG